MSGDAQLHPSDSLGWLVDRMADPDGNHRLCPKACARAKAALLRERAMMTLAAERDSALCAEIDECQKLLATLVYWHDQGHIDESWWDEARKVSLPRGRG